MKEHILEFEKPLVELARQIEDLQQKNLSKPQPARTEKIAELETRLRTERDTLHANLTPWQRVQISRHPNRPYMLDYVSRIASDFLEIHGDRHYGDDHAMPAGFATIDGRQCVLLGHQKGRETKENLLRNFGSAHPEGYRKALRVMRMGEKFKRPILSLIDTPGAYPGIGAEERNIAEAIAFNLREMMLLRTPIVAVIIGEGGSGGALGVGVADRVLILENAYYSVISPEGCAAILWKHRQHAPEAAAALKLSAADLNSLGVVDGVIPEPPGGAHKDHETAALYLQRAVTQALDELQAMPVDELLEKRYEKFRRFGTLSE